MRPEEDCSSHDHDHDDDPDYRVREFKFGADAAYRGHGIQFRYPGDWIVTEDVGPDETTISVHSSGVSYWSLTLIDDAPDPSDIIDTVLGAYRGEYSDLDVYEPTSKFRFPAVARDIDFVCLDLVNSASVMAFRTNRRTVLVVFQGTDRELELTRSVLESMTESLLCEEGLPVDEVGEVDD